MTGTEGDAEARELREALAAVLGLRSPGTGAPATVTVLGAGSDDLEAGRAYLAALAEGGWAVPAWPREYGGRGARPEEVARIARELARFEAPDLYPYLVGLHVVGPTLLAAAAPEQCRRWLPTIANGAEIWCQLFSEPGAGSDLANVATRAERDGGVWRVTGQKVWSSRAHYAHWGLLLARSDPHVPKHAGITAFAVRMQAPGVEVRPLRQMNGDTHFSEVFLDDVVVPDADRIGAVGGGWSVARTALANERGALGAVGAGLTAPAHRLLDLARDVTPRDAVRRDHVTAVHVAAEVARLSGRRSREAAEAGRPPGPEGSIAKLRGSPLFKATASTALELLGPRGVSAESGVPPAEVDWATLFLTAPSISIRGGTDEIQRNIVGERILGLPAEPRADIDKPWDQVPH